MAQSTTFERAASFYDETRGFPPGEDKPVMEMLNRAGNLNQLLNLLEVGVGTGRISLPLAPYVGTIYGIDLAVPMMNHLIAKRTNERVRLTQADATRLPFADNTFDRALVVHVFHLIPDWRTAVAEVARVLKPDGLLLNAFTGNPQRESWWKAWDETVSRPRRDPGGITFNQQRTYLVDLGWRRAGDELSHSYEKLQTPKEFIEKLRQRTWSSTWRLTDEELEEGVASVKAALEAEHGDLDQTVATTITIYAQAYHPPSV